MIRAEVDAGDRILGSQCSTNVGKNCWIEGEKELPLLIPKRSIDGYREPGTGHKGEGG